MIYFMQAVDGGPVKIGFTDDLPTRHYHLERHYGRALAILATMEGGREREAEVHAQFAHLRFGKTEQFRPSSDLMVFIGRPLLVGANPEAVEAMKPMRPYRPYIRVDEDVLERAGLAANLRKMSLADYVSEVVLKAAERDIPREAKKLVGGERGVMPDDLNLIGHTKGPWIAERQNWRGEPDPHRIYISGDVRECFEDDVEDPDMTYRVATGVAIVEGNASSHKTTAANARLIAASPELLKALVLLVGWCEATDADGSVYVADAVARARSVIAKATAQETTP